MDLRRLFDMIGPSPRGVDALHSIDDFRGAAQRRLPRMVFDFVDGGADGELAVASNRAALDAVRFSPRTLVDVADREVATTVLGAPVRFPLVLSPSGLATVVHPEGELAVARAAADAGVIFAVSTASGYSLEEIADVSSGRLWFQLYLWKSDEVVKSLVQRASDAGYEALVVTTDVPVVGKRERDLRNGMSMPMRIRPSTAADALMHVPWLLQMLAGPDITFASLREIAPGDDATSIGEYANRELTDPSRTWDDLAALRRMWDGPLLVKGVMNPDDARRAVSAGVDGVIVSNHGGRQISSVAGVADVVPRVVEAVGDRAEVFLDGGVRRGEDIVKAKALGARAACGGRLWFWPLAAAGQAGVAKALDILCSDVDRTLALVGSRRYDDVDHRLLV